MKGWLWLVSVLSFDGEERDSEAAGDALSLKLYRNEGQISHCTFKAITIIFEGKTIQPPKEEKIDVPVDEYLISDGWKKLQTNLLTFAISQTSLEIQAIQITTFHAGN